MCGYSSPCHNACVKIRHNLWELVFSFYHVDPSDWTQVTMLVANTFTYWPPVFAGFAVIIAVYFFKEISHVVIM